VNPAEPTTQGNRRCVLDVSLFRPCSAHPEGHVVGSTQQGLEAVFWKTMAPDSGPGPRTGRSSMWIVPLLGCSRPSDQGAARLIFQNLNCRRAPRNSPELISR